MQKNISHKTMAIFKRSMFWMSMGLFVSAVSFCGKKSMNPDGSSFSNTNHKGNNVDEIAVLETKFGKIKIKFFSDVAPKHVESFKKLTREGFFNGTIFHRVIPGFMIQGGDPKTKDLNLRHEYGTGNPGYTIPAEFSNLQHMRGIVSAARSSNPNSAGSQFFIMVAPAPHLDGQYSIFGEVIEGLDIVDQIVAQPRDPRDNPNERIEMQVSLESVQAK